MEVKLKAAEDWQKISLKSIILYSWHKNMKRSEYYDPKKTFYLLLLYTNNHTHSYKHKKYGNRHRN